MKLIEQTWNPHLNKYEKTWLANTDADLSTDFDPDCAEGSLIMVIASGSTYMKNADGKWQKYGTAEVL